MTVPDLDPGFESKKRPIVLLSIGATIGLVLAAWGVLENVQSRSLPANSVARVNGTLIRAENYERLVEAVMGDMRTPDLETASQRVIERMIDEELLVQRALDLGLVHLDRKVRSDLTSSVINSVVSAATALRILIPTGIFITNSAKANWRTRPHTMMRGLIAFRSSDARYAMERMTARPTIPM